VGLGKNGSIYAAGWKRCSLCGVWVEPTEDTFHSVCGRKLRTAPLVGRHRDGR
jgi:hypothetical protein